MLNRLSRGQFCGSLLNRHELGSFTLTEYAYPPNLDLSKHEHEQVYFSVVLEGAYDENFGARARSCRPLTFTFHPSGESHSDCFHRTGGRIFSVELERSWIDRMHELSPLIEDSFAFDGGVLPKLALKMYREFRDLDELSHLTIEGLSLEVIAETARRRTYKLDRKPPRWLSDARELLQEHFAEPLTLSLIAQQVGVHPVHLAREFRRHYQLTVGEFIRKRRVEYACQQLSTSNRPLADIAMAAGFSQQSHFSKTFKRFTGMTPKQYWTITRHHQP